jgi:hypothetical protein
LIPEELLVKEILEPAESYFADVCDDSSLPSWVNPEIIKQVVQEVNACGKVLVPEDDRVGFSVVIPTRSSLPCTEALRSVIKCQHNNGESMEVILSIGNKPSLQRNRAIEIARGEHIGFLDDDCLVPTDWMRRSTRTLGSDSVKITGGPNLTPLNSSFFSRCVGKVLSSRLGTAMMRARYTPMGMERRSSTDESTALCNMVFSKELFDEFKFNEKLYPNEENELLVRMSENGHRLMYDPKLTVTHPRKEGLGSFARQFFSYGSGRAWQTKIQPRSLKPIHLLPSLTLIGLIAFASFTILNVATPISNILMGPLLLLYMGIVLASSGAIALSMKSLRAFFLSTLLYPTLHFSYGAGFILRIMMPIRDCESEGSERTWLLRLRVRPDGH